MPGFFPLAGAPLASPDWNSPAPASASPAPARARPIPALADLLAAFQKLLPRGEVWPRDSDTVQTQALAALMPTPARNVAAAAELLIEAFPAMAGELLPEWEDTLGLPDPCAGPTPTILARQAAVVARLASTGGQSCAYFAGVAANLGAAIAITEYAPMRWGVNGWGQPLYTPGWAYVWTATLTGAAIFRLAWGPGAWGEPLWQIQNNPVACELAKLKPAHTLLFFTVAPGVPTVPFTFGVSAFGGFDGFG